LSYYGIYGTYVSWLKSYLTNRKEKVHLWSSNQREGFSSSWGTIKSGVPQGLVLGPLRFLIYINDLPYGFHNGAKFVLYADDTSVLVTANDNTEEQLKLHSTLNNISNWFTINGLSLNIEKTNTIKFSTHHRQEDAIEIIPQNKLLDSKENTKFLGLEIDKHLKWKDHIEEILPKLSTACYAIRSTYYTSSIATLKVIYLLTSI
jgi:hypothetical protein